MKWLTELLGSPSKAKISTELGKSETNTEHGKSEASNGHDKADDGLVHAIQDDYGKLVVTDYADRRVLSFDSPYEQSSMSLSQPYKLLHGYTQLMALVLAFNQPFRVTLLGLGGGSLLRTLHHVLPDCTFEVVELRQKVVDLALEHFSVPNDTRVNITVDDARTAVEQLPDNSTDILFSDLYDAYNMLPEQVHKAFLLNCARVIDANGWLVMNLHKLPEKQSEFMALLLSIFPVVYVNSNSTNTVLLLSNAQPNGISANFEVLGILEEMLKQEFKPLMSDLTPYHSVEV